MCSEVGRCGLRLKLLFDHSGIQDYNGAVSRAAQQTGERGEGQPGERETGAHAAPETRVRQPSGQTYYPAQDRLQ